MKKLILLSLLLAGCGDNFMIKAHEFAKLSAPERVCYDITQPQEIVGHYCLQYMGKSK